LVPGERIELPTNGLQNGRLYWRFARKLEAIVLRFKSRPEDRRVERILEAVAHERGVVVLDVHVELTGMLDEEVHDLAVIGKLPLREHYLIRAFLIELSQPSASFVWAHRRRNSFLLFPQVKSPAMAVETIGEAYSPGWPVTAHCVHSRGDGPSVPGGAR
jgi:hypothetical protein